MALPAPHEPAFIIPSEAGGSFGVSRECGKRMLPASPSCSTSAGSPSPPSSPTEDNAAPLQMTPRGYDGAARDLPEYEYPVPSIIGDGFIDRKAQPVSLDELLVGRRVHSCPVGPPPGLYNQASTAAVADATATCLRSKDMQTDSAQDDLTPVSQKAQVVAFTASPSGSLNFRLQGEQVWSHMTTTDRVLQRLSLPKTTTMTLGILNLYCSLPQRSGVKKRVIKELDGYLAACEKCMVQINCRGIARATAGQESYLREIGCITDLLMSIWTDKAEVLACFSDCTHIARLRTLCNTRWQISNTTVFSMDVRPRKLASALDTIEGILTSAGLGRSLKMALQIHEEVMTAQRRELEPSSGSDTISGAGTSFSVSISETSIPLSEAGTCSRSSTLRQAPGEETEEEVIEWHGEPEKYELGDDDDEVIEVPNYNELLHTFASTPEDTTPDFGTMLRRFHVAKRIRACSSDMEALAELEGWEAELARSSKRRRGAA